MKNITSRWGLAVRQSEITEGEWRLASTRPDEPKLSIMNPYTCDIDAEMADEADIVRE